MNNNIIKSSILWQCEMVLLRSEETDRSNFQLEVKLLLIEVC
jgi:hypothetical protein